MKKFNIAFGGFYESNHMANIESQLDSEFMNDDGEIEEYLDKNIDYKLIFNEYSRMYLEYLQEFVNNEFLTDIQLNFCSVISPKEYNFTTDKIETEINEDDFIILKSLINDDIVKYIDENSKSRDGFISFYDGFEEVIKDDSILLEYIFDYIIEEFEEVFMDYYDRNYGYELICGLQFEVLSSENA